MLRLVPLLCAGAAAAAMAASVPATGGGDSLGLTVKQAKDEAAAALAQQKKLEDAAARSRDEASRLHAERLAAAEAISAAEAQITAADAQLQLAQGRLSVQRQALAREQAPISALLGALALTAQRPPLLQLADARSVDELVKLRILLRSTTPVIRARTAALSAKVRRGDRLREAAVAARTELQRRRDELEQKRTAFAGLERRAAELASRRGSQALGAGDVALALGERADIAQGAAASRARSAAQAREMAEFGPAPLRLMPGKDKPTLDYRLPADAPVTDGLGAVSASGVRSRGITLATRRGSSLVIPASGTILFAGPFRDYDGVVIIDHGGGWKSVLVNAGSKLPRGAKVRIGEELGIALGPVEVQLQHDGNAVSPALIAGSSAMLSNRSKGG